MENIEIIEFLLISVVAMAILVIGVFVIKFIITSGKNNKKDAPHALGLPAGSVRAILALTLVVLFVFISLFFYLHIKDPSNKKELAENIITILGTLVVAVSSFYFGIKATQQGSEIANKAFDKVRLAQDTVENIPAQIIQEALMKNKESWKEKYNCIDIKLGKKETEQTKHDLNCLVFLVASKKSPKEITQEIPSSILYVSKGIKYNILTDVQEFAPKTEGNRFVDLPIEKQKEIINEFIKIEATNLKKKYPEIQGLSARPKKKDGLKKDFYCLHIDVIRKLKNIKKEALIPSFFLFNYRDESEYKIPTDITGVGKNNLSLYTGDGENPKQLGLSCSRKGKDAMGTIGLKVYKSGFPYLLSCYHVLCAPELKEGITTYKSSSDPEITSPGFKDGTNCVEIAEVTEGYLNNNVDVALAKLTDDQILENRYYKNNGKPQGKISLTSNHSNEKIGVRLVGRSSGKQFGKLIDNNQAVIYMTNYPSDTLKDNQLWNMIITEKISTKGDSGATVVDYENKVIGLLVGDNDIYSFVIPIATIFNKLQLDDNF